MKFRVCIDSITPWISHLLHHSRPECLVTKHQFDFEDQHSFFHNYQLSCWPLKEVDSLLEHEFQSPKNQPLITQFYSVANCTRIQDFTISLFLPPVFDLFLLFSPYS